MEISEKRLNILKTYYLMLEHLLDRMAIKKKRAQAKKRIHEAIKRYHNVSSFRLLDDGRLYRIVANTRVVFARDFGVLLKAPNEPDDVDDLTMQEFLKLIKYD